MSTTALKPASGKPAPRVHQVQGLAGALPMHMVRAPLHRAARIARPAAQAPVVPVAHKSSSRSKPASQADNRVAPVRAGADDSLALPSRVNDTLRYRSGLVTDMAGNVLEPARSGSQVYRPSHSGQERARPAFAGNR